LNIGSFDLYFIVMGKWQNYPGTIPAVSFVLVSGMGCFALHEYERIRQRYPGQNTPIKKERET